ncbi:hypothetical protein ILUMI_11335 [Ignelater luminosus]|uniref:DDE-1 domain-containing protein n=1 Tax=Ignelater luminosus TaxID=2038154 RepID=A0A8K0GCT4_IGNLU|nr:hypothetical protein ILUMI_11335 [Ignelater luminosus]
MRQPKECPIKYILNKKVFRDEESVMERWKEYFSELNADTDGDDVIDIQAGNGKERIGYQKAPSHFSVPRSILRDRVKVTVATAKNVSDATEKRMGRFKTVFTKEQEEELVSHLLEMTNDETRIDEWGTPGAVSACHQTAEDPELLLLDGHASHTKNLGAIGLAKENHAVLICFPPHCTHRLQPLDVGFTTPLRAYYGQEIKVWLRSNPGRVVTQFEVAKLFGSAYAKAATVAIAMNAFAKTGISPLNQNMFSDVDFVASNTPPPSSSVAYETVNYKAAVNDDSLLGQRNETKRERATSVILTLTPYKTKLEANKNSSVKPVKRKVKFGKGRPRKKDIDDNALCEACHRFHSKSKKSKGWDQCQSCKIGPPEDQRDEKEIHKKPLMVWKKPVEETVALCLEDGRLVEVVKSQKVMKVVAGYYIKIGSGTILFRKVADSRMKRESPEEQRKYTSNASSPAPLLDVELGMSDGQRWKRRNTAVGCLYSWGKTRLE